MSKAIQNTVPASKIIEMLSMVDADELKLLEQSLARDTRKSVVAALKRAHKRIDEDAKEAARIESLYEFQKEIAGCPTDLIVGLDEVGRGPLAGPLCVGAVVLPDDPKILHLNDSKKIKPALREEIAAKIKEVAIAYSVAFIEPVDIDRYGIIHSLKTAFSQALKEVETKVDVKAVLLDGNPLHFDEREINIVKGDTKCASIAAASIIAKAERDSLMDELDLIYPGYDFASNKGYGTSAHRDAIRTLGLSPIHRISYCSEFTQESLF